MSTGLLWRGGSGASLQFLALCLQEDSPTVQLLDQLHVLLARGAAPQAKLDQASIDAAEFGRDGLDNFGFGH
jgi:hypothetical protein